jgi:hypothetical protein
MMAVATHAPVGFAGTIDEIGEAKRFYASGVPFRALDAASWLVTSVTTSSLTVTIAPGVAECCGVYDTSTAASTLVLTANGSGSTRLDAVVARWTWGAGANVSFAVITGTPGSASPPTLTRNPGVVYEALLAVVSVTNGVGSLPPGSVFDVRTYGGVAGPLVVSQGLYYTYVDVPTGGELTIGDPSGLRYMRVGTGLVPLPRPTTILGAGIIGGTPPASTNPICQAFLVVGTTNAGGFVNINFPQAFPNGVTSIVALPEVTGSGTSPLTATITTGGYTLTGCSIRLWVPGSPYASAAVNLHVIAHGW